MKRKLLVLFTVQVVGLSIFRPDPTGKSLSYVLGRRSGTTLHVRVARQDKTIISLDRNASKLSSFTDDKGTVLSETKKRRWGSDWLGSWPRISDDGHSCMLKISSPKTPAAGASKLIVKADIVLACGSDIKTAEQKDFALTKGSKLTVGPVPMKVQSVKDSSFGKAKMRVELISSKSFDAVKALTFIGADGKEIKYDSLGEGTSGIAGKMTYSKAIGLHKKVDVVTVKVTYYQKIEKLTVPLNLTVGVGL